MQHAYCASQHAYCDWIHIASNRFVVEIYIGNPYHSTRLVQMRLMIELDLYIHLFSMELRLQSFEKPYVASSWIHQIGRLGDRLANNRNGLVSIRTFLSLYRPAPWTKFCPQFASKMGTYVCRDFFHTTEFSCTYVHKIYCEIFVRVIFRVIQLIPKLWWWDL